MSNEAATKLLAKQIKSELAINKITIIDGHPVSSLPADRESYSEYKRGLGYQRIEGGPSPRLSRERVMHALNALNEGIRIGYSSLCFPNHADVVREVALDSAVANFQVLDWAIKSDKERDPFLGAIARNALKVVTAVIESGGEVRTTPMKALLENNRDTIARGAQTYKTWSDEYVQALKLTQKGTEGYSLWYWTTSKKIEEKNELKGGEFNNGSK